MKTTSRLILEATKKEPNKFGCLMLTLDYENSEITKIFDKKDLCEDEGGIEDFKHITVLYGFHDDQINPKKLLEFADNNSNFKGRKFILNRISLFENEKFDVVKFDVMDSELNKLNKNIATNFPNTNKYPVYHAHATIAYVLPGLGKKYQKLLQLKDFKIEATPTKLVYSSPNKKKTEIDIH